MNDDVKDMLYDAHLNEWVQLIYVLNDGTPEGSSIVLDDTGAEHVSLWLDWTDTDGRAWDDLTDEERAQWTN